MGSTERHIVQFDMYQQGTQPKSSWSQIVPLQQLVSPSWKWIVVALHVYLQLAAFEKISYSLNF